MKEILNKLNINIINKILKILYILLIIFIIYIGILICKEWKLCKFFITLLKLLSPLFLGIVLAYLLNPLVCKMSKRINRKVSVFILYFIIILLIIFLIIYIYPKFKNEFYDLLKNLPYIIDDIEIFINNNVSNKITINIDGYINNFINNNIINKVSNILNTLKNIIKVFGIIILGLIISFYLLLDLDKINNYINKLFNFNKNKKINKLLIEIDEKVFSFVKGTSLIALIVFVVSCISFELIHLKGSIFFAIYNALTNIIPYIGPYIGAIPILIVAFTQSKKVGILALIIILSIQIIESYVFHPLIMSKSMKLHPVSILISLLLFGYFFGIIGMVIAMPVVSVAKTIAIFIYNEKTNKVKSN